MSSQVWVELPSRPSGCSSRLQEIVDEREAWRSESRRRVTDAGLEMNTSEVCGAQRRCEGVKLGTGVFEKVRRRIHHCKNKDGCMTRQIFDRHHRFFYKNKDVAELK